MTASVDRDKGNLDNAKCVTKVLNVQYSLNDTCSMIGILFLNKVNNKIGQNIGKF